MTEAETTDEQSSALRCLNPDGCLPPKPPKDTCGQGTGSLSIGATELNQGQSTTLTWVANLPAGCSGPILLNGAPVGPSGTMTITPLSNFGYLLQVGTNIVGTVGVKVKLPDLVYIDGGTFEWVQLLIQAAGPREPRDEQAASHPRRVVISEDVDMDVGVQSIVIEEGVTITSELYPLRDPNEKPLPPNKDGTIPKRSRASYGPQPSARDARHLGPRILTRSRQRALFSTRCEPGMLESDPSLPNNIHITGFRIEGPDFTVVDGDDKKERGLEIDSCRGGVEVDNMEISGFGGAAVFVSDSWNRMEPHIPGAPRPFSAVRIHDSFFHHNQHVGGEGYGVDFGRGAYGTVERNVFDFNRHAVTSSGFPGTGYIADHNLILKGGGHHDQWYSEFTHQMDVHGDSNCGLPSGTLLCGNAGDQFFMTNNAFQYEHDFAIKIRGTPTTGVNINGNVFTHSYRAPGAADHFGQAIFGTQGYTNINTGPNTYSVDTFGDYGVCDFDGDGKDDLFLATGASWWFNSAAKSHWVYMSPNTERLSQVRLGDFNGDKRCDVIAKNTSTGWLEMSSGGTGPWTVVPGYLNDPLEQIRTGDFNGDGITDIFFRGNDGQWWAISPGIYGWIALQNSSVKLEDMKLGDFNGDGFTDVLGWNNGKWAISYSGLSTWQPAANLTDDIKSVLIGNVDGSSGDDVIQFKNGGWQVSSGARQPWTTIASSPFDSTRTYVGKFDDIPRADILAVDSDDRVAGLYGYGHAPTFVRYNRYHY